MKKALIFYLWGRKNAGDMAICLGAASLLIENGYEVTFVSRFTENQEDYLDSKNYIKSYFKDVKVEPGIFELDRNKTLIHKVNYYTNGIRKLLIPRDNKKLKALIEDSDIIFLNGGNLLRGKNLVDYARIFALFYPFKIAAKYDKKIISLPQSTASSSGLGMKLIKKKLSNFDTVFIRESNSFDVLTNELQDINFVKTTDVAFYINDNPNALKKYKAKYSELIPTDKSIKGNIALILRSTTIGDLGQLDKEKKESMALNIINHIKKFHKGYNFFIVVQTHKDKEFSEYIMNKIEKNIRPILIEEYDTFILREIYKDMDFVIAMRLHAAILSMTAKTPVIGYFDSEWGLKNPGIMNDIGLPWTENGSELIELSYKIITEKEKFINLINEFIIRERTKISKHL